MEPTFEATAYPGVEGMGGEVREEEEEEEEAAVTAAGGPRATADAARDRGFWTMIRSGTDEVRTARSNSASVSKRT